MRTILSDVERDCAKSLDRALALPASASLLQADADILIETMLRSVGDGVTAAIRAWDPRETNWQIFVWPGYERIAGAAGRAVLLDDTPPNLRDLIGDQYMVSGQGRRFTVGLSSAPKLEDIIDPAASHPYDSDLNVEWFNLLLREGAGANASRLGASALSRQPPSTHAWFALYPDRARMPRALCVRVADAPNRMPAKDLYALTRYIDVHLPEAPGSGELWSQEIARRIEVITGKTRNTAAAWPASRADFTAGTQSRPLELVAERMLLYDVWLTSCFYPARTLEPGFIEGRIQVARKAAGNLSAAAGGRWRALEGFLLRARDALATAGKDRLRPYKAWYAIPIIAPLNHRVSKGRMEDATRIDPHLGTAMILSDRVIDTACLEVVSAWVRSMYLELRSLEIAALEVESATEGLTNSFGHEVSKMSEGLFKRSTVDVGALATWPQAPFVSAPELDKADRALVESWQVVTVPQAQLALQNLLHTWGTVSFAHWGLPEDHVSLSELFEALAGEARNVAAARLWIDEVSPPSNMSEVKESVEAFEWAQKQTHTGFVLLESKTVADLIFHRPTPKLNRREDRFAFLVRLFMALMSNSAFHAPGGDVVSLSVERVDGRLIFTMRNAKDPTKEESPRGEFRLKSDGVVRSCLQVLGGTLIDFPRGDGTQRIVSTQFSVPIRHADDVEKKPWIEIVERRHV